MILDHITPRCDQMHGRDTDEWQVFAGRVMAKVCMLCYLSSQCSSTIAMHQPLTLTVRFLVHIVPLTFKTVCVKMFIHNLIFMLYHI